MSKNITVAIRKGGSGKTATAFNLAAALSLRDKKVLLIDLDSQGDCSICQGIDPEKLTGTMYDLFINPTLSIKDLVRPTGYGFDYVPANDPLSKIDKTADYKEIFAFKEIIAPVEDLYDYIIFDTPTESNFVTPAAYSVSRYVIIPMQAHPQALSHMSITIKDINVSKAKLNNQLELLGILPTMYRKSIIQDVVLDRAREVYKDLVFSFHVPFLVAHIDATAEGKPVVIYDKDNPCSIAYNNLANIILGKN